ncbi:N-6 DNA Methylase [Prauserella aidingensis]|uniref:N-6 DNA methylase n=1 Tax=Prauserella aidingensis TaxID=387890 RepID=UPI0020A2EF94|nr:N-6 DNA methylase [Prauserella aidingensis]MCP2255173.1 N-6 DNA Methylase [Prauserella aidingensis]
MSDETWVTAAEIARLANVGRAAVSNWRKRHADFPEPVVGARGAPTFRLDEVQRWLRTQGKPIGPSPVDVVWRALDVGRGDAALVELTADIADHLTGHAGVDLPERVRAALDELGDTPPGEVIEELCTRIFDRQQRQHLVTPPPLAELMMDLTGEANSVFDPACGSGNVLRAAAEAGAETLVGQEIEVTTARIARARLREHGKVEVAAGDALRHDAFTGRRFDAVVCDPPFGYRDWGHEELGLDPRWEYGLPVKGEPELAWVQHCLAHAEPGGSVVVALPAGAAGRRSGRTIRQALLRRGALRAVVALPAGVLMSTGIAVHLWVLRNPAEQGAGPVLLVDTARHRPSRRGHVDWDAIARDVGAAWDEFCGHGTVEEVAGRHRTVEPIELLDEDVDVTPARHLPQPLAEVDLGALQRERDELARTLAELDELLPAVREATGHTGTYSTINDLARAGALTLRQRHAPVATAEDGDGPRVLTGRDVATCQEPTLRYAGNDPNELTPLQPGDLVVPLVAAGNGTPSTQVVEAEDLVLGPNLSLLRVDGDKLNVHFLAGQLRASSRARALSTTASGVHRLDIRRAEVPVLPLERQRELGEAFRRLARFETRLRQAGDTGRHIATHLTTALADGTIEPDG